MPTEKTTTLLSSVKALRKRSLNSCASPFSDMESNEGEAPRQLRAAGLVEMKTHRRTAATSVSALPLSEFFELRALLEGEALRHATTKLSDEHVAVSRAFLKEPESVYGRRAISSCGRLDPEFHGSLIQAELPVLAGRCLARAIMIGILEAWSNPKSIDEGLRAFYRFHACSMEARDDLAAIVFSDCAQVGAILDRNGLHPAHHRSPGTASPCWPLTAECSTARLSASCATGGCSPSRSSSPIWSRGHLVEDKAIKQRPAAWERSLRRQRVSVRGLGARRTRCSDLLLTGASAVRQPITNKTGSSCLITPPNRSID